MNSKFDAKQVSSYDFGILAVITFGGKCPEWAEEFPPLTGTPTFEILIVRGAVADIGNALQQLETENAKTPYRLLVIDDALAPEQFECAGALWLVSARSRDLDTIAEAFARMVGGNLFIGVALADAIEIAGGGDRKPQFGRGAVIEGLYGDQVRRSLEKILRSFAEDGFAGSAFILQSISAADDAKFDLVKYDELTVLILGDPLARSVVLTAYPGASATAWITIAFGKPPSDAATDR